MNNNATVIMELACNPRFLAVLERCMEEDEFIEQFERLSGMRQVWMLELMSVPKPFAPLA